MATKLNYSKLGGLNASFEQMMQSFGVVTVMNADVYELAANASSTPFAKQADQFVSTIASNSDFVKICTLETLKVANVTIEGPDKTITGGRYNNPLVKFGKTARLEMQDALGHADAIDRICGGIAESEYYSASSSEPVHGGWQESVHALHFGEDFSGALTIIGDTFFIDQKTGQQVKAKIVFYQFIPDSMFNLTQDAEGDATVFDMNGDLLTTEILISDSSLASGTKDTISHGVFYSIVDPDSYSA